MPLGDEAVRLAGMSWPGFALTHLSGVKGLENAARYITHACGLGRYITHASLWMDALHHPEWLRYITQRRLERTQC